MPDETGEGTAAGTALRTLADNVNWLTGQACPAGRGPWATAGVAAMIEWTTGEPVSHTSVWTLRNGQAASPQMKLIAALARTIDVQPGFLFYDLDENQAGLLREQAEPLALVRGAASAGPSSACSWS